MSAKAFQTNAPLLFKGAVTTSADSRVVQNKEPLKSTGSRRSNKSRKNESNSSVSASRLTLNNNITKITASHPRSTKAVN
jgi:hypothetical protein